MKVKMFKHEEPAMYSFKLSVVQTSCRIGLVKLPVEIWMCTKANLLQKYLLQSTLFKAFYQNNLLLFSFYEKIYFYFYFLFLEKHLVLTLHGFVLTVLCVVLLIKKKNPMSS